MEKYYVGWFDIDGKEYASDFMVSKGAAQAILSEKLENEFCHRQRICAMRIEEFEIDEYFVGLIERYSISAVMIPKGNNACQDDLILLKLPRNACYQPLVVKVTTMNYVYLEKNHVMIYDEKGCHKGNEVEEFRIATACGFSLFSELIRFFHERKQLPCHRKLLYFKRNGFL